MSRTSPTTAGTAGPVLLGPGAHATLRPAAAAAIEGGFWQVRRAVNARAGIPQGPRLLESAGNLHDLRLAAGTAEGDFRGDYPFMDSDVYKWLEAASWQLGQSAPDGRDAAEADGERAALAGEVDRIIGLVAAAQQPDGYLNTWFQVTKGGARYQDLRWGHELYCAGHLIQAAVAHHRSTGGKELLRVATRFADHIDTVFGPGKAIESFDGHPEVETALVELYRETGSGATWTWRSTSWTGTATACSAARPTARTGCRCARPRTSKATRCASSTCWRPPPTWPARPARPNCAPRASACGGP